MKYILAISGGIDSVVLLHLIVHDNNFRLQNFPDSKFPSDFIVAHFDHGVRVIDSARDAEFVRDLAKQHDLEFVLGRGNLSTNASEELARKKRYEFLANIVDATIITAHHADDLIETVVINLIRGTGWRGLAPMCNERIVRPLLSMNKSEIIQYAIENNLDWVEDITNFSPNYFRNRVRSFIYKMSPEMRREFLNLYHKQKDLREKIENILDDILSSDKEQKIDRVFLNNLPEPVAVEFLRAVTGGKLTRPQLKRTLEFAKTAKSAKKMEYKHIKIVAAKHFILVTQK